MPNKSIGRASCVAAADEAEAIVGMKDFLTSSRKEKQKESLSLTTSVSGRAREPFSFVLESVSDYAIFAQDANGSILSWNPGVAAILGYNEEEFVGKHVSIIFTAEDIERGEVDDQMRQTKVKGRAEDRRWHVRRDGSLFWSNGLLMPLWDGDRKLRGYARVIRDDTERKKIEDEQDDTLRREREARRQAELLRQSLERAEYEKDEFLAQLAHELRNPLNAILGWLAILRNDRADDGLLAKGLKAIESSARSQDRMIEDVVDLSRFSSGNLRFDAKRMSLNDAVAQAVESIRPAANAKGISLETSGNTKRFFITGDFDRIKQVIVNILSNAVKFTPSRGRITLRLISSDTTVRMIIEDNGRGFSQEFQPRIFDRYAQADKGSMCGRSGLGLGLPIVREIVEKHDGRVTAESAGEGLGATFTVYLPLFEAARIMSHM